MSGLFCNICEGEIEAFEPSAEGVDECPRCRSVARHRAIPILLNQWAAYHPSLRSLEIGGDGRFYRPLFHKILCLDRSGPGAEILGDVERLCFAADTFDVILCLDVLEHVANDREALNELARVLTPNGRLFVTASCWAPEGNTKSPQEAGLPEYHIGMSGEWDCLCYRYYTLESLERLVLISGLECRSISVSNSRMGIDNVDVLIASKRDIESSSTL